MKYLACILAALLIASGHALADDDRFPRDIDIFPVHLSPECRAGTAALYDECGSQEVILRSALKKAITDDKAVLIVYGGEWCSWCHVLDKKFQGYFEKFTVSWERDTTKKWVRREIPNADDEAAAMALNKFVADNFVVTYIEGHLSSDGADVINSIGFDESSAKFFPIVISLSNKAQYANHFEAYKVMSTTTDATGKKVNDFDLVRLLHALTQLRDDATRLNK